MQRKLFFLACFFVCASATAQPNSFVRFTTDNGLSNNVVYATHQDSKGYLWIATHDGLNRYDGYVFQKFLHNPFDKKSLAGNMAIDIIEDEEGRIWVLTNSHLQRYDKNGVSFERYALPLSAINHSNESASRLISANKDFLLLNHFKGLFVFNKKANRFRPLPVETGSAEKPDLFNFPFFKDREGNVLISAGSAKGVLAFDPTTVTLKRKLPLFYQPQKWQNETVTSVYTNKKNKLVYCTQEGNKFLLVTGTGKKHFLLNRSIAGITVFLESIREDEQGDLWIGYGNRLFQYQYKTDSLSDLSANLYSTSAGSNFIIKSMCIDNFSNLWLGLYEAGLLKASIRKPLFTNFSIHHRGNFKLPYSSVYGIIKNPDETLIVRYYGTPMASLLDATAKKLVRKEFKFHPADTVMMKKLFPQFGGMPFVQPFYRYLNASTRFTFNNGQFVFYKDGEQNFWTVNFNTFTRLKDNLSITIGDHINCFYEGGAATFWVGTDGSGLVELNYKTGSLKKFLPQESNPRSISSQFVNGIVHDEKKGLWLATRYGLNYFDFNTRQFNLLSEEQGLCNNTIYTIEKDRNGKLWLGTSNGLSCYDPQSKEFTNYTKTHGLVNSEYNRNGTIALANGWIVMGGTEGIDIIMPDSIHYHRRLNRKPPPLVIQSFTASDSVFYSFNEPIQLSHHQNNVTVSFAALDLTQPYNNKYRWQLEPAEQAWSYALGKHEVNYAGLPPGKYTFKINAAGSDGVWNEKDTMFSFIITAPWWQSGWVLVAAILSSIGLVTLALRYYYHQKFKKQLQTQRVALEKQQAIERERTRIATDMHDDLGAGLSRIKFLSETVGIKKQQQQPIEEELSRIRECSHEMISKMGEIVWALNEKNDTLGDLLSFTRAYAIEYLSQNGIAATVSMPDEIEEQFVSGEFRRNIFLSVKEALHNVVKHAMATTVHLDVTVAAQLTICIRDDGKGFGPEPVRPSGNGLSNMHQRMHQLGGVAAVQDNGGTEVRLSAPLHN